MAELRPTVPIVITLSPDTMAKLDQIATLLTDIATALAAPDTPTEPPTTYFEALAANGGLLNAPPVDGGDHHWRTFRNGSGLYGCCVTCAQRCLTCSDGMSRSTTGLVCQTCGTDYYEAPQ